MYVYSKDTKSEETFETFVNECCHSAISGFAVRFEWDQQLPTC